MSRSYDDRIVRMGFDNAQFEAGTKQTMTTLDKLNEKLKLPGASEGSKNVQTAVDSVDFSAMEKAILNIEKRFSTLGVVSMNVISKITDGITGSVAKLEAATLGQIKTGGWNRAMNIANAKFQIEGLGFAWEQVEKAVSYGVKDTAYGLDAAASAASQLAASGVDFQEVLETVNGQELTAMHKSLRAISGVAAMTNSSYEDIARIFTTVAGNGRLMGDQLLQLSSRGMNAAAKLAETLGTTEGEIREMVSKGQIDFQTFAFAMDNAFGDHAKEANKTFTGALGNMKAALSRVGEIFSDPIINKTNTLFISLTTRIDEFKNKLKSIKVPRTLDEIESKYAGISKNAAAYEATLKGMGDRTIKLGEDFAKMWQSGIDAFSAMIKSVDLAWFDKVVEKVDNTVNKITEFFDLIREIYGDSAEEAASSIESATEKLVVSAEEAQAARDIIDKGMYGNGDARKNALTELFGGGDEGKKHAENVQAYIDSVVAAGWSYEKAAIQVEQANDAIAESEEDAARESKKARLKKILDEVSTSFSNLWTVAKNLGKTGSKLLKSFFTAINNVFKIDLSGLTEGVSGFTGILANLSEKLVLGDDIADVFTGILTKLFSTLNSGYGILKNVGDAAWDFITGIGDSKMFKSIESGFDTIWEKIQKFATGGILDSAEGEVTGFFEAFSFSNVGKAISDFFKGVQISFDDIELPKSIKNSEFFKTITDFIDKAQKIIDDDSDVPTKIANFINAIIQAIDDIKIIDAGKMMLTVWGIITLAKIFLALDDLGKIIGKVAAIPAKVSDMISNLGKMFNNLGKAALNVSVAMVIKAAATAILEIIGSLIIISQIPADDIYRATTVLIVIVASLALLMKVFNKMSGFAPSLKVTLINITAFASNLLAIASVIVAVGGAIMLVASAFAIINASIDAFGEKGLDSFKWIMVILFLVIGGLLVLGAELKKSYNPLMSMLPQFFGMSLVISAFGGAVFAVASAMAIIGTIKQTGFEHSMEAIALIWSTMVLLLAVLGGTKVSPGQLIAVAVTMVGFAAAMAMMIVPITALAVLPASDKAVDAVKSLMGIALIMMGGIAVLSKVFSGGISKAIGLIAGVIAMQLVMTTLVTAITAITAIAAVNPEALAQAANTIAMLMIVAGLIGALLGIGAAVLSGGKSGGKDGEKKTDALFAIGAAFIMIAGALYILAQAISVLGTAASNPGFAASMAVMIGFLVVVAGLAAISAAVGAFGVGMKIVGDALLKAGAGFALVGAGVLLMAYGIKILAPAVTILAAGLAQLFTVIEAHIGSTIGVALVTIIILGLLVVAITQISKVLTTLASIVASVVSAIAGIISSGTSKLKSWSSGLSTKGKAAIVTIITTLCAAILKASPQVLNTVGQLLIKLLSYLGSIAGDLAEGLVDFLINLINGLSDAIRLNTNRILNALMGVLGALVILVLDAVKLLVKNIPGVGDWLAEKIDEIEQDSERVQMEMRKAAEEADAAKKDIHDSILGIPDDTEKAFGKTESLWDKFGNFLGKKTDEQGDQLDDLKEKYADTIPNNIAEYMQAKNTTSSNKTNNSELASIWSDMNVDMSGMSMSNVPSTEELMSQNGLSTDSASEYGADYGCAFTQGTEDEIRVPDEYYYATTDNMGGVQDAIKDSEKPTYNAVKDYVNEPSKQALRENRRGMYEAAEWSLEGAIGYFEHEGKSKYGSALTDLMRAGQDAVEKANEINSPSKVYFELASYMVAGLVNGIEKNADDASGAMGDLSSSILAAFSNPLDYLTRIINGDLVYDPSIRPVFDGSGLYKGASSINSMLGAQTISVAGLTGKLATDIGTLDQSNQDIINELRALREDVTLLGDDIAEMQVVMDSGALVGSIAAPMDKALGARSIKSRRG